jgi:electron transport complex protein RnfD
MSTLISGPHTHAPTTVSWIMGQVMLALVPTTAFGIYLFGFPALNLFILTILTCVLGESICLYLMNKPIRVFILDGSAVLTGWLVALTLPPWAPWWIAVLGGLFSIIIGKQVFGGIGQNVFNPAMLARVMLLVAFPLQMTTWINPIPLFSAHAPSFIESLSITFGGIIPHLDSVSSASLLGNLKTELTLGHKVPEILVNSHYSLWSAFNGWTNGSLGETSALLILLGGLYLMYKKIISWHIPVSMLASTLLWAFIFTFINPDRYEGIDFHLFNGGLFLTAFFIATDFVTSPATPIGKIIFGVGCGTIAYVIRTWGAFPEGVGFAVLLMNALSPLMDHYTRPRIYGRLRSGAPMEASK